MTTYSKSTLATFFQTGDVPTGTDYANLIDSCLNIVDTSAQSIASPFNPTELITPRVSATNINAVTSLTAATISVTNDVSAGATVYASAMRASFNYHGAPVIISAAGTAQATGALLTAEICRLQGATDGSTTGFSLPANRTGWVQYLANECTVSANLWPPTGGRINNLANNAVFAMAAGTPYIVMHSTASAYSVK